MKKDDPARNALALNAWEEWKKICWVAGCSVESQRILNADIYKAFKAKFNTICPLSTHDVLNGISTARQHHLYDGFEAEAPADEAEDRSDIAMPYEDDDNEKLECQPAAAFDQAEGAEYGSEDVLNDDDFDDDFPTVGSHYGFDKYSMWALTFDMGVINTPPPGSKIPDEYGEAEITELQKRYKDYVWNLKATSPDPPLKVIRGKLTGPLSIMNEIAERYLRENHQLIWENYDEFRKEKARINKKNPQDINEVSLDSPIGEDGDGDLSDIIADPSALPPDRQHPDWQTASAEDELSCFTPQELALILAHAVGSCVTSKEVQSFIGRGHDAISRMWNDPVKGLLKKRNEHQELFGEPGILSRIISRIRAEKDSESLLLLLKARFTEKGMGDMWE